MTSIFVSTRRAGLANRLRALAGYWSAARLESVPLLAFWPSDQACDAKFEQLFEIPQDMKLLTLPGYAWKRRRSKPHDCMEWYSAIFDRHFSHLNREEFHTLCRRFLSELKPVNRIGSIVDDYSEQTNLDGLIGLHIRHTDNLDAYAYWSARTPSFDTAKISTLVGFEQLIDSARDAGRSFFLCTDSSRVKSEFVRRFPSIQYLPIDYRSTRAFRPTSMESALIEMLVLSRCNRIVGTYFSSFSKVAALIGRKEHYEIQGTSLTKTPLP